MTTAPAEPAVPRRHVVAAYAATGAKVLAWAIVSAIVYRTMGPASFALLVLVRGTLGILNYTSFGLGVATMRMVAEADATEGGSGVTRTVVLTSLALAGLAAIVGTGAVLAYANGFESIHDVPAGVADEVWPAFVISLGLGMVARLAGDVPGGLLQARGKLGLDQSLVGLGDLIWPVSLGLVVVMGDATVRSVGVTFLVAMLISSLARLALLPRFAASPRVEGAEALAAVPVNRIAARLLGYGGLVTLGNVADFLYAPIDLVILNRYVSPTAPAVYGPAIQIDAAILLLTTAIATVVLPTAARLSAGGDRAGVWRLYVRGSLAAAGIAGAAAIVAWALSPWLFELWLGDDLPLTRAILPIVLLHTTIGAAAGVGRSTLLAVGKAGPYAASVLVAGLLNAGLSWWFASGLGWGIAGVVWATVIAVTLRCVVWMPWYVRRSLVASSPVN